MGPNRVCVITVYGADGRKVRRPVGFRGASCHAATAPYEARELPGQTVKTPVAAEAEAAAEAVRAGVGREAAGGA